MVASVPPPVSRSTFREVVADANRKGRINALTAEEMLLHVELADPREADAYMADIIERLS
ncbi:MAG: hypothetical protein CML29_04295 [Rhizobiales bacterium]|nr:hypothetical protein [Hyphomicrobiales bacterium]MBA68501.1 hypothetical protein [Hyphomicrobiales bacterium]|tara:strand:- start:3750 stop:3929 length:180 start_codon:yes stop_codon:yes gene_type:complete